MLNVCSKRGYSYLRVKICCLTVGITRLLNLYFYILQTKRIVYQMKYVFQTYLKSILLYYTKKTFTRVHSKNKWLIFSISVLQKVHKGEFTSFIICIDNHMLGLFYEEFEIETSVTLKLYWIGRNFKKKQNFWHELFV